MALNEPERSDTATFELQSAGFIFYNVYSNHFGLDKVIVSSEWIPESVYVVDHETQIYAPIDGHQIALRFLAHITEHSGIQGGNSERVIGFMLEKVTGARSATLEDLLACAEVLAILHAFGIAHGSIR
jgi:hypothetical protein